MATATKTSSRAASRAHQSVSASPTKRRKRSTRAKAVTAAFRQLSRFYASDAELGRAVGMSRETVRLWKRKPPSRPRVPLSEHIMQLWQLCLEAVPYMRSPNDVGRWTLTANPRLDGQAPVEVLLERGREGLAFLIQELADLTPRQQPATIELPTGDELRSALVDGIGEDAMSEVERMVAATLHRGRLVN